MWAQCKLQIFKGPSYFCAFAKSFTCKVLLAAFWYRSAWQTAFLVVCPVWLWCFLRLLIYICLWTLAFSELYRCYYVLLWQHAGSVQRKAKDVSVNVGARVRITYVKFNTETTQNDRGLISSAETQKVEQVTSLFTSLSLLFHSFGSVKSPGGYDVGFSSLSHTLRALAKPWQGFFPSRINRLPHWD